MKESTTSLPILCCVPLTAGINILHNLTISVRDENGDYKLLQPSSLLLYFQKSFSRQNVRKKMSALLPKGRFSSGGSEKAFFYRDYLMRKENDHIFHFCQKCAEKKIKTFFSQILKCVTFPV